MVNRYWEYPSPLPPMRQTTAPGAGTGLTLVDATLIGVPSKVGQYVWIVDGGAAEQAREITAHNLATGELTLDRPCTDGAGAVQQILLGTRFYIIPFPGIIGALIAWLNTLTNLYHLALAELTLNETGGTLLATAAEQVLVQVAAPMGSFKPTQVQVNCTNMAWGDRVILKYYERIAGAGGWILKDEMPLDDVQIPPLRDIDLGANRHGFQVTLQQIAGAFRNFDWEYLFED